MRRILSLSLVAVGTLVVVLACSREGRADAGSGTKVAAEQLWRELPAATPAAAAAPVAPAAPAAPCGASPEGSSSPVGSFRQYW